MQRSDQQSVRSLLESVVADYPSYERRVQHAAGPIPAVEEMSLDVGEPSDLVPIPTFDSGTRKNLSPMLRDRMESAGEIRRGYDLWLDAEGMQRHILSDYVQSLHQSLRTHWERSAPMLFPDDHLGLFGVSPGDPSALTYLVWTNDRPKKQGLEPQLWLYSGMSEVKFADLAELLRWCLAK